jgi:NADH-quinone oxidoreductase subunit G
MPVADVSKLKSILLVGSTVRKEQPLFAVRLREGTKNGLAVSTLHVVGDDLLMPVVEGDRGQARSARCRARQDGGLRPQRKLRRKAPRPSSLGQYAQQHPDFAAIPLGCP